MRRAPCSNRPRRQPRSSTRSRSSVQHADRPDRLEDHEQHRCKNTPTSPAFFRSTCICRRNPDFIAADASDFADIENFSTPRSDWGSRGRCVPADRGDRKRAVRPAKCRRESRRGRPIGGRQFGKSTRVEPDRAQLSLLDVVSPHEACRAQSLSRSDRIRSSARRAGGESDRRRPRLPPFLLGFVL